MKRSLDEAFGAHSDSGTSSAKRTHAAEVPLSIEHLSDEVLLLVLGCLDAATLCTTQSLNKRFDRLSCDRQIWRHLYQAHFPRARWSKLPPAATDASSSTTSNRSGLSPGTLRQLGHISSRDRLRPHEDERNIDWKRRYHVRSNWLRGRCKKTTVDTDASEPDCRLVCGEHTYLVQDKKLYIDEDDVPHQVFEGIEKLEAVHPVDDKDRVLLVTDGTLFLYDASLRKLYSQLTLPPYNTLLCRHGFLATLSRSNTLTIYCISNEAISLITCLKGLHTSSPQINLRSLARRGKHETPLVVISLVYASSTLR